MKHFHITDEKTRLANEIHHETVLLMEQEKDRDYLLTIIQGDIGYAERLKRIAQVRALNKSIENRTGKIKTLQTKHDSI